MLNSLSISAKFDREGFLVIENALTQDEVDYYLNAIDEPTASDLTYKESEFYGPQNVVTRYPVLAELIDHPRHVGFGHDIYGELLKLHISQVFLRPHDSSHNAWCPYGTRAVPYGVFSPILPMGIKIGYWLTDLPAAKMGTFVCMPVSHRLQYFEGYRTRESMPGERVLCCKARTMTILHCDTWHRVEPNESDVVRKNIFLAYCPSWVCEADRVQCDSEWLETPNREQRIIMRSRHSYARTKPPKADFPLFLERETGADSDADFFPDIVPPHLRKRRVTVEQ